MKKLLITTLALTAIATALTTQSSFANAAPQVQNQQTWLGVSLAPVPKALAHQLKGLVPKNQGVMVQSVSANSPASKAGLQTYDILLSFNDQQLYSAQQLAGLISSSTTNSNNKLSVIRNGKKQTINITLATHNMASQPLAGINRFPFYGYHNPPYVQPFMQQQPFAHPLFTQPILPSDKSGNSNIMQQFESISIKQTGDGKVRAEVSFATNGDKKNFTFEGQYEEVRKQIKESKELPEDKKNSLLTALQNEPNPFMPEDFFKGFQMPAFPSLNHGFFNQPPQAPSWFNNGSRL